MQFSVKHQNFPTSEEEILNCLGKYFTVANPQVLLGRGDDCALVQFDRPMAVIADTVAMSEPHEIEYTIRFTDEQ